MAPCVIDGVTVFTAEEVKQFVDEFKNGVFVLYHKYVTALMPVARKIGRNYCIHEGVSVAFEALCDVPYEIKEGKLTDYGIIGYTLNRIKTCCTNFFRQNHVHRIPTTTAWRHNKRLTRLPFTTVHTGPTDENRHYLHSTHVKYKILEAVSTLGTVESWLIKDELQTLAKTQFESEVIRLKQESMTDQEVAQTLGCHRNKVVKSLTVLRQRYLDLISNEESEDEFWGDK